MQLFTAILPEFTISKEKENHMGISIAKPVYGKEEEDAVIRVLRSGCVARGPETVAFEQEFADFCGAGAAVATTSGTTALQLAMLALGIGEGDEVITTPFSFIASSNSILYTGGRPVFCDIDPVTFNIDTTKIEALITDKTKAIMPVHLYGHMAEMDDIMRIAKKHNLLVIEDACQAHGATYKGQRAGSIGDAAAFSFYPTKNMGFGEGGMATFKDPEVAKLALLIHSHGMEPRYYHHMLGYNFRTTDIASAMGRELLKKLPGFNQRRQENASYLLAHITNPNIVLPSTAEGCGHVYHQFTIKVTGDRDAAVTRLTELGIGTSIFYPVGLNEQEYYTKDLGYECDTPIASEVSRQVISIPVHPQLSEGDLAEIAAAVNSL